MKRIHQIGLSISSASLLFLSSCGGYGDEGKKASAVLTANKTSVIVGETVEFDATASEFETISWTVNGSPNETCSDSDICVLQMTEAGVFDVAIEAKAKLIAQASVQVTVSSANSVTTKKSTAASANTTSSSSTTSVLFSPDQISGLKLWLDAANSSSLFQASSCTGTPSTASSDPVGCWKDLSGNGNDAVQTINTSYRPVLNTAGINSVAAVDFNADGKYLTNSLALAHNATNKITIFAVARMTAYLGVCNYILDGLNNNGTQVGNRLPLYLCSGTQKLETTTGGNAFSMAMAHGDTGHYFTGVYDKTNSQLYVDDLGGGVTSLPDLAATSGFTIGSRFNKAETMNGSIGEILIYNSVLSDSDRDKVWQYLANKWKLYHPEATWIAAGNYDTPKTVAIHSGKLNQQQVTTNHSPLVLWLDAQDSSRFYTNTACTTAAVAGNTIACWDDKSPSNNDAIQATGGNQLTYVSAGINNKNSLNSTVNGQNMTITNNTSLNPTNYTMFVVANFTSDSENWPGLVYKTSNYGTLGDGYGARFGLSGGNYIQYVGQGGTVTPRINGVGSPSISATINTPYIITLNNATAWTATSVDLKIGKDGPGYNIGEVLLFGTTLSTAQIQQIEGYLASRWGVSL